MVLILITVILTKKCLFLIAPARQNSILLALHIDSYWFPFYFTFQMPEVIVTISWHAFLSGAWLSWLERRVHIAEIAGSSPAAPKYLSFPTVSKFKHIPLPHIIL